jgi:hypothetical protein
VEREEYACLFTGDQESRRNPFLELKTWSPVTTSKSPSEFNVIPEFPPDLLISCESTRDDKQEPREFNGIQNASCSPDLL